MTDFFDNEPHAVVERNGVRYTLIGTAHVSQKSADVVSALVRSGNYDAVAVELCTLREQKLFSAPTKKPTWRNNIKDYGLRSTLFQRSVGRLYKTIERKIGVTPGSEFKAAITDAQEHNIPYLLIDQDYRITAQRVSDELGLPKLLAMTIMVSVAQGIVSAVDKDQLVEHIEGMKHKNNDAPNFMMSHSLTDERDAYMVNELLKSTGYTNIIVVVGAKHLKGMVTRLQNA